ncbi:MAG: alkaline phosphatase family protein [Syntrophobacteraceae bacterium]
MNKVLVIGLDGADWSVILPLAAAGKMPNMARLLQEGSHGPLRSSNPPITFPAWSSFMTGVNPGKHGIYDFCERVPGEMQVKFYNATDIQREPIWRVLNRENKSTAFVGVPLTYPPEPLDGLVIPGFDAPGIGAGKATVDAVYPRSVYDDLEKRFGGYKVAPNLVSFGPKELPAALERVKSCLAGKGEIAKYLHGTRDWDFFMVVFGETDNAGHYFWRFSDPSNPLFDPGQPELFGAVAEIYGQADELIGQLLEASSPETNLIVLSDHGMGGCNDKVIHLNLWLAQEGYLTFKKGGGGLSALMRNATAQKLFNWTRDFGVRHIPHSVKKALFYKTDIAKVIEANIRYGAIDWENTLAYSEEGFQFPSIRVNLKGDDPRGKVSRGQEYENVMKSLTQRLLAWTDPWSGTKLVKQVQRREEVYSGPLAYKAADLHLEFNEDGGHIYMCRPSGMASQGLPIERLDLTSQKDIDFIWNRNGKHRPEGIFLGYGPAFARGMEVRGMGLVDMVPLISYLCGAPIPADLDGRLATEILREDFYQRCPPRYQEQRETEQREIEQKQESKTYTNEEAKKIEDRLKALGYL